MAGMIHIAQKTEGKNNSIIFRIAIDNFYYYFWHIDNNFYVGPIYHYYLKMLKDEVVIFE